MHKKPLEQSLRGFFVPDFFIHLKVAIDSLYSLATFLFYRAPMNYTSSWIIHELTISRMMKQLCRKRCDVYNRELTTDITRYMDVAMKILKEN